MHISRLTEQMNEPRGSAGRLSTLNGLARKNTQERRFFANTASKPTLLD
jgi:hypothetical protein